MKQDYGIKSFGKQLLPIIKAQWLLKGCNKFVWGEDVGHYVIMSETSEYLMSNWKTEKLDLLSIVQLVRMYLENGEDEIRNFLLCEFFCELVGCPDLKDQSEILELLGPIGEQMMKEANISFTRNEGK